MIIEPEIKKQLYRNKQRATPQQRKQKAKLKNLDGKFRLQTPITLQRRDGTKVLEQQPRGLAQIPLGNPRDPKDCLNVFVDCLESDSCIALWKGYDERGTAMTDYRGKPALRHQQPPTGVLTLSREVAWRLHDLIEETLGDYEKDKFEAQFEELK